MTGWGGFWIGLGILLSVGAYTEQAACGVGVQPACDMLAIYYSGINERTAENQQPAD